MMAPSPTGIALASDPGRPFDSASVIAKARPLPGPRPTRGVAEGQMQPHTLDGES